MNDLLTPRVILIYWYPGSPFNVGEVLTLSGKAYRNQFGSVSVDDVKKAQAIFLELEWYEERDINEMPFYLKGDDGVFQVLEHFKGADKSKVKCFNGTYDTREHYRNLVPATYDDYKNHLEKIKKVW